ncbi:MAG: hypothetical protein HYV27_09690 [Candidatus Hydrogenedentes bacterium]|nr:hypothetical protein [Candidatus Hydrogenedentota bacterium]
MQDARNCPHCQTPIGGAAAERDYTGDCPACGVWIRVQCFPALDMAHAAAPSRPVDREQGDASCFYHEEHAADGLCCHCGRYLCGMCSVIHLQQTWCTGCLETFFEANQKRGKRGTIRLFEPSLQPHYRSIIVSSLALAILLVLPFVFMIIGIIVAIASEVGG